MRSTLPRISQGRDTHFWSHREVLGPPNSERGHPDEPREIVHACRGRLRGPSPAGSSRIRFLAFRRGRDEPSSTPNRSPQVSAAASVLFVLPGIGLLAPAARWITWCRTAAAGKGRPDRPKQVAFDQFGARLHRMESAWAERTEQEGVESPAKWHRGNCRTFQLSPSDIIMPKRGGAPHRDVRPAARFDFLRGVRPWTTSRLPAATVFEAR